MPELPEVEVVRQSLRKSIKYKKVKKVIVKNRNLRFKIPSNFPSFMKNLKIIDVNRFSKYLILCLSNKSYCLVHLGMSGTIHLIHKNKKNYLTNASFYNSPKLPEKHNHLEIIFNDLKVIYNDPRRFGFFQIIKNDKLLIKRFENLGPEPFHKKFSLGYVVSHFKGKKKNIKNFLIDQNFVSGIGNIYASEILFLSKINPEKKVSFLRKKDLKNLILFSKQVLTKAINRGGSSIKNFKNISGKSGNFQKNFNVYDREGKTCKNLDCRGIIEKKIISNRSTFFCKSCQK